MLQVPFVLFLYLFTIQHKSWKDIGDTGTILKDPVLIIELFLKMIHLSVSTATRCGKFHVDDVCEKLYYKYISLIHHSILGLQMTDNEMCFYSKLYTHFRLLCYNTANMVHLLICVYTGKPPDSHNTKNISA